MYALQLNLILKNGIEKCILQETLYRNNNQHYSFIHSDYLNTGNTMQRMGKQFCKFHSN